MTIEFWFNPMPIDKCFSGDTRDTGFVTAANMATAEADKKYSKGENRRQYKITAGADLKNQLLEFN
jgi:hypothetical protein